MTFTRETQITIAGVDGRFFLIQSDGSIRTRDDWNRVAQFVFNREATARVHAKRRPGVRVFDKQQNCFI